MTRVFFDGKEAEGVSVSEDGTFLTCTVPHPGVEYFSGPVEVVVETPAGRSHPRTWKYEPGAPSVMTVAPEVGSTRGGTPVTITGSGFKPEGNMPEDVTVRFGDQEVTVKAADVKSATEFQCVAPKHAAGPVDVSVKVGNSAWGTWHNKKFTYQAPLPTPQVKSVTPDHGSTDGKTPVTITGTGFKPS